MKYKICVTGGAGFIGSHLVDRLVQEGHRVFVIDNFFTGAGENLNNQITGFYPNDIQDPQIIEIFKNEKPDIVFHLAALANVSLSMEEPNETISVNVNGTLNLLEASKKAGVKKFIFISTGGALYGESKRLPADESTKINPESVYGLSKFIGEELIKLYGRVYGINFTILRLPNVYGPRQNPKGEAGVVAIFTNQMLNNERPVIFGDGNKTRDYVYVLDIVEACFLVMTKGNKEILNLGWSKEIKDIEIFKSIKSNLDKDTQPIFDNFRIGEVKKICLNNKRAKKVLGWKPKTKLSEGISTTVKYYQTKKHDKQKT